MGTHPLLRRQIKRYLEKQKDQLSGSVLEFLDAVDQAYHQSDADRMMLERSLDLSSRELLQANSEMRAIFQSFPDLFFRLALDGRILDCRGGSPGEFFAPREQIIGKHIQNIPLAPVRRLLKEGLAEAVESGIPVSVEYTLPMQDEDKYYELRLVRVLEDQLIAIVRDMTERRKAEERLKLRSREIFRHQDALHELTLRTSEDLKSTIEDIVRVAAKIVGADRVSVWMTDSEDEEMAEEYIFVDGEFSNAEPAVLQISESPAYFQALHEFRAVAVHDTMTDTRTRELVAGYLKPRHVRSKLDAPVRLHGSVIGIISQEQVGNTRQWTPEEEHFAASVADLISMAFAADERRELQAQLLQSQKMEAVGMLAGGVSHDFSNLLTVMLVYTDLLLQRTPQDSTVKSFVMEIQHAAQRAEALTRQLLAFSRKQVLDPRIFDLNGVVRGMENMLRTMIGEDIDVVITLTPDPARIKADEGQIEQVLMNLVVNARDAMPWGGRLAISTGNINQDRSSLRGSTGTPALFVILSVSDTGVGMDGETLARIFEPFFTTKQDGKGSGLGLSTVYGIVEQSSGHLDVESRPGVGTTFTIYFPVAEGREEPEAAIPVAEGQANRRETILLVEDEDSLRHAAAHALREEGYIVREVRNGIDAIAVCERFTGELALVITDVVMPQMDGRELGGIIAKMRPQTRMLYISGYAKGAILDKGSLEPNAEFLAKPFRLAELIRKVREVLSLPV